jgi:hypothetical protein
MLQRDLLVRRGLIRPRLNSRMLSWLWSRLIGEFDSTLAADRRSDRHRSALFGEAIVMTHIGRSGPAGEVSGAEVMRPYRTSM